MKKTAILALCLLGGSFILNLFLIQAISQSVPGKSRFIFTSLWDPFMIHAAMTLSIMAVFMIVLGMGKIFSKKFKWGKWKSGLVCALMLLFWILIFGAAYGYSVSMTGIFVQGAAQLSVGPLMPSLKVFVFYFLRHVLIFAIGLHLILGIGWIVVRLLRKKKQVQ